MTERPKLDPVVDFVYDRLVEEKGWGDGFAAWADWLFNRPQRKLERARYDRAMVARWEDHRDYPFRRFGNER